MAADKTLWPVLAGASEEELAPIVELLAEKSVDWTRDPSWSLHELRSSVHDELLANGGNSFANLFRGGGVSWAELVRDVAEKVDIAFRVAESTTAIEERVALKILEQAIDEMTPEQCHDLRENLARAGLPRDLPIGKGALLAAIAAGNIAGFAA